MGRALQFKPNGGDYKEKMQKKQESGQEKLTKYFRVERTPTKRPGSDRKNESTKEDQPKSEITSITDYFQKSGGKEQGAQEKGRAKQAPVMEILGEDSEVEVVEKGETGEEKLGKGEAEGKGEKERKEGGREEEGEEGGGKQGGESRNVGLSEILESVGLRSNLRNPFVAFEEESIREDLEIAGEDQNLGKRSEFKEAKKGKEGPRKTGEKVTKRVKGSAQKKGEQKKRPKKGKESPKKKKTEEKKDKNQSKTKKVRSRIKKQSKGGEKEGERNKRKKTEKKTRKKRAQNEVGQGQEAGTGAKTILQCRENMIKEDVQSSNKQGKTDETNQLEPENAKSPEKGEGPKTLQNSKRKSSTKKSRGSKSKKKSSKQKSKYQLKSPPKADDERELLKLVFYTFEDLNTKNKNLGARRKNLVEELIKKGWKEPLEKIDAKIQELSDRNKIFITDDKDMIYKI